MAIQLGEVVNEEELRLENEKRLLAMLSLLDIHQVKIDFEGGGDSGQIGDISFRDKAYEQVNDIAHQHTVRVWTGGDKKWHPQKREWAEEPWLEQDMPLDEAMQKHIESEIEDVEVDWWNNDGGYGEWVWKKGEGLTFDVYQRIVESVHAHGVERQLGELK